MSFRPLQDVPISLTNLQDEMNRMFQRVWHGGVSTGPFDGQQWAPAIDLYERTDGYILFVEVAGVGAESIDVSYSGNTLTIRGDKGTPTAVGEDDQPIRRERRFGTFCRTIELPGDCDTDRLAAKCHAGVLEITIPKSEGSRPRVVKIDVEEG